jgi:hypothetical protein
MAIIANCSICGSEFRKIGRALTCSPSCSKELSNKRSREWSRIPPTTAECVVCESSFERRGPGSNQVQTCSRACRAEHKRAQAQAYQRANGPAFRQQAKERPLPTAEDVRELLSYEPMSGSLTWKARQRNGQPSRIFNAKFAGKQAGTVNSKGYLMVSIHGRDMLAHRVIWLMTTGEWPDRDIDHEDGDGLNNQLSNLRLATESQNLANSKKRSDNSTGWKGVSFNKGFGRYIAQIGANGKKYYLGHFATAEDAHAAYVEAAKKYHGEFARAA